MKKLVVANHVHILPRLYLKAENFDELLVRSLDKELGHIQTTNQAGDQENKPKKVSVSLFDNDFVLALHYRIYFQKPFYNPS